MILPSKVFRPYQTWICSFDAFTLTAYFPDKNRLWDGLIFLSKGNDVWFTKTRNKRCHEEDQNENTFLQRNRNQDLYLLFTVCPLLTCWGHSPKIPSALTL
jgi:hypothetical protein